MKYPIRWAEWLAEGSVGPLPAAIVMVVLYCCIQIMVLPLLSLWAGTGVGVDDAEQLMHMQRLWAGYGGSQPPLYTWINWAAAHVFGTNIFTLKVVKYSVLLLASGASFAAMRRLDYTRTTATAAMFGLFTVPQIVWESQRALSHSVAVIGFCALLVLATVHLLKQRSTSAYVLFGLAAAAAALAKYNDLLLVTALAASALSVREFRGAILSPKILGSIGVAALAVAPTAYWDFMHPAEFLARQGKFGMQWGQGYLAVAAKGASALFLAVLDFALLPTVVFGLALVVAGFRLAERNPSGPVKERFLWRTLGFGLAFVMALVLVSGTTEIRNRWLLPVLFGFPLAMAAYMDRLLLRGRAAQVFVIGAGAAFAMLSMFASWYFQVSGGTGQASVLQMNYHMLYRDLTADGPVKTVVSDKPFIGNLRLVDESLITLDDETANFASLLQEPIVLVWLKQDAPNSSILDRIARAGYLMDGEPRSVDVPAFGSESGRRVVFVKLKSGAASPR